jgi:hypothetical protein
MLILASGLGRVFRFGPGTAPGTGQANGLNRERLALVRATSFACERSERYSIVQFGTLTATFILFPHPVARLGLTPHFCRFQGGRRQTYII